MKTSFGALAKMVQKAKIKMSAEIMQDDNAYKAILNEFGEPAAIVWAFLSYRESHGTYGAYGEHILKIEDIANACDIRLGLAEGCVIALARNGLCRITPDERVKAA